MPYGTGMLLGPGPYQRQDTKSEISQPLLAATIYVALFLFVWLPAVYLLAVLSDWLFAPLVCGTALALLFDVRSGEKGALTLRLRPAPVLRRAFTGVLLLVGALPLYLRCIGGWGWTWAVGDERLWIGTPWGGTSVAATWEFLRWALVIVLPLALIPTGRELCGRFLTEIAAPNLPNSIRAIAGRLRDRRRIEYTDNAEAEADAEIQTSAPHTHREGGL